MVKKISTWKSRWNAHQKNNIFAIKLGISVLFLGLLFTALYSKSQISSPPIASLDSQETGKKIPTKQGTGTTNTEGKCDLFNGDWIPYMGGPSYTNMTCSFIEDQQNCMKNGRPDSDFLYYRWKPHGCDLPRPDATRFLRSMRNKNWAWIGDSISRNHVQSFLCILSRVETAFEVYHTKDFKNRKWVFPSYNFSVSITWAPFLAKAIVPEDIDSGSPSEVELHLDELDKTWANKYKDLDYIVISSGKWFLRSAIYYENNVMLGCHYCPKRNCTEVGFNFAYRKVLRNVFDNIIASNHKGVIYFRTSTPDHFEGGQWFEGGSCKRSEPAKEGEFQLGELNNILRTVELEEFEKALLKASEAGVNLKLLDVSPLSLLRPDGHPGAYRFFQPFAKDKNAKIIYDCLHWCLPGPIDSWNDLLMELAVNGS